MLSLRVATSIAFAVLTTTAILQPAAPSAANGPSEKDSQHVPAGYEKVFADEMDSPSLDTSKWWTRYIYEGGLLNTLNDERQLYAENDNHIMKDGILHLTAHKKPTTNPRFQYESGLIRSKPTFKYGYFEARVKCPKGLGVWPAFWLNSDSDAEGKTSWPPEVDILEFPYNGKGEKINSVHLAVHQRPPRGQPNPSATTTLSAAPEYKKEGSGNGRYLAPFAFPDDYHIFACLWDTDDTVAILVDGKEIVKWKYKWVTPEGKAAPNAHVLLNLGIGGKWAGAGGIDDSAFPQSFEVDYVRVYQKPDAKNVGQSTIGTDLLNPAK